MEQERRPWWGGRAKWKVWRKRDLRDRAASALIVDGLIDDLTYRR